ncbi:MAG TPA: phage portal protein, partial [Pirellulales bacterium]|nr:phage portal protein [Pirellulales bacterium]
VADRISSLNDEAASTLLESIDLLANYVDPFDRFRGPNGQMWQDVGTAGLWSYTDCANFKSEKDLSDAREYCRLLARRNPYAINIHENMTNYIVGDGHKYTLVAKAGMEVGEEVLASLQTILDEWQYANRWGSIQQESVLRLDRDGEYFRRLFVGDGDVKVRFVEPHQVSAPTGSIDPNKAFGIETDPEDVQTVLSYWIDGAAVAPEEIQHVKLNVDSNVRRGVPTTWPIGELLRMAVKVEMNIGKVAAIQTKVAIIERFQGATLSGLQSLSSANTIFTNTNQTTGRTATVEQMDDGQIIRARKGYEMEYPAGGIDVTKFGGGAQFMLRCAASRICFPEFMFTSDASNANYASTMVSEGPAVRMFERRQAVHKAADLEILWMVLEQAASFGAVPESVLEQVEIQVTAPTLAVRDGLAEASENQILAANKVLSIQTWRSMAGLDGEQEEKNIDEYEKAHPPEPAPLDQFGRQRLEEGVNPWRPYP